MNKLQLAIEKILSRGEMTEGALIQSLKEYGCFVVIDELAFSQTVLKEIDNLGRKLSPNNNE